MPIVGVGTALALCKLAEYTNGKGLGHLNTLTSTITMIIVFRYVSHGILLAIPGIVSVPKSAYIALRLESYISVLFLVASSNLFREYCLGLEFSTLESYLVLRIFNFPKLDDIFCHISLDRLLL
jgi:hypothetical protein